ncbi:substrate-binding periplasmic protein [Duganella callida]|uniref:Transporter substrate-binding domain-containing protein n=1 Tax=Duganella callida TaxID=2561932 RepID=A0A4Y9SMZ4_9BURK|nr:transporter substrate-binding domain-containing protein [Duganella callida]TFW25813.1 transporter substrate-binding domain-containing protein [Duganella callida]
MRARLSSCLLSVLLLLCASAPAAGPLKIYGMESQPISFLHGARADGFAVELTRHLQQRLGRHEPIEIVPWARASAQAELAPDVLLLSIVRTPERERHLQFAGALFTSQVVAYAVKGRAERWRSQHTDLHTLRGGARRGSIFVSLPRAQGYRILDETNTSATAARMLMNGRFDLWFDSEELAREAVRQAGYQPADVEVALRLDQVEVDFAFSRGTPAATVQAWADALREAKRDGSFGKIFLKWLPPAQLPADAALPH